MSVLAALNHHPAVMLSTLAGTVNSFDGFGPVLGNRPNLNKPNPLRYLLFSGLMDITLYDTIYEFDQVGCGWYDD